LLVEEVVEMVAVVVGKQVAGVLAAIELPI
jgi:hypothetical protein